VHQDGLQLASSARSPQTFTGPRAGLRTAGLNLAVFPGGDALVSAGQDGTVAAWDLSGARRLGRTFRWRSLDNGCETTPCFVIDPQGSLMASALLDGRIALVDLGTKRRMGTLPGNAESPQDALAFFPDGHTLAAGGADGNVTL
jgi:WD40 repeat protein